MDLILLPAEKDKRIRNKQSILKVILIIFIFRQINRGKSILIDYKDENKNAWEDFFSNNRDFLKIRERYKIEFMQSYKQAFENFIQGKWDLSKKLFEMSNFILGENDYIIDDIIRYMSKFNFVAPDKWNGTRNIETLLELF